jgi:serine/threonine-protein kinase HipA
MTDELSVRLGGVEVATLSRRRSEIELAYLPTYTAIETAVPLSLSLPLSAAKHRGPQVARFLDSLLPDNGSVRESWARHAGLNSAEPLDLIGAYGRDVAGAFSFHNGHVDSGETVKVSSNQVGDMIEALVLDSAAWQPSQNNGRFSLPGAQAKTSLHFDGTDWYITSGDTPSTHILKPAIPRLADSDLVEHVTMFAARRVGIATANTWVGTFAEQRALVVERFDRSRGLDGMWLRVHQEDLLQALGVSRLKKHQSEGGPTPEHILAVLDSTGSRWAAEANKTDYLKQLAFHWMIASTDAHAKNYSVFLLSDNHLLTPMYDAASYLPYLKTEGATLRDAIRAIDLSANIAVDYTIQSAGAFEWQAIGRKARLPDFDFVEWMRQASGLVTSEVTAECERLVAMYDSKVLETLRDRMQVRHELTLEQLK